MNRNATILKLSILTLAALVLVVGESSAQYLREEIPGVGGEAKVVEKLNAKIDLDLVFRDEEGRKIPLRQFFDGRRPVLLTLNYANCPSLCGLQLNGLVDVLSEMEMLPGEEFEIVTVSIDPREKPIDAKVKKAEFIRRLGRPKAARGWHFMVGERRDIEKLADSVGFGYGYDKKTGDYAHAAVCMLMTPAGRVSRYIYGHRFVPQTMRLSLVEASEGKIGTTTDRILLYCYVFDPDTGVYTKQAFRIVQLVGVVSLLLVGGFLLFLWRRERSRKRRVNSIEVVA
jgi:protein SCO1